MTFTRFTKFLPVILLFLITSCSGAEMGTTGQERPGRPGGPGGMPPLNVDVFRVPPPRDIPVELKYPARLKSTGEAMITARVSGTLEKIFFKEGDVVQEGTLLFKIEPDVYLAEVNSAKAQLEVAMANLKKAKRDWTRTSKSFEEGVVSERERDAALSAHESAKAGVDLAEARLRMAEIELGYTDVRATISGKTGMKLVDIGNMVNPGTNLVTLTRMDPIYAEFSFPDMDLVKVKYRLSEGSWRNPGGKLHSRLLIGDRPYGREGHVDFIDTRVNEETSSVKARAVFPNPDSKVFPGQFTRIIIRGLVRKNAVEIPQKAMIQGSAGAIVFVAENGVVAARPVEQGDTHGDNIIIEKGLKPGDAVIVSNLMKIRPGMPVSVATAVNGK